MSEFIRIREAAERLGYARSYASDVIPQLLPTYQLRPGPTSPRVCRVADLEAFIAGLTVEPEQVEQEEAHVAV